MNDDEEIRIWIKLRKVKGPQCLSGSIRAEPFSTEKTFDTTIDASSSRSSSLPSPSPKFDTKKKARSKVAYFPVVFL